MVLHRALANKFFIIILFGCLRDFSPSPDHRRYWFADSVSFQGNCRSHRQNFDLVIGLVLLAYLLNFIPPRIFGFMRRSGLVKLHCLDRCLLVCFLVFMNHCRIFCCRGFHHLIFYFVRGFCLSGCLTAHYCGMEVRNQAIFRSSCSFLLVVLWVRDLCNALHRSHQFHIFSCQQD